VGEDVNQHLDLPVKIVFNTMMLGVSTMFCLCVMGLAMIPVVIINLFM